MILEHPEEQATLRSIAYTDPDLIVIDHDFETFCRLSIFTVGGWRYAQDESCEPLMLSWGHTPEDIETWLPLYQKNGQLRLRPLPKNFVDHIRNPRVMFQAHNAEFEYAVWEYCVRRLWPEAPAIHASRYICTAVRCAASGLPRSLDGVGRALNLPVQKDKEGGRLLNMFSKPQAARKARKPSKANPNPVGTPERRIMPWDEPEEFDKLIQYNITDVVAEMMIPPVVPPLPPKEQRIYTLTLEMNRRGLPLDMEAVNASMPTLTELEQRVERRVLQMTDGVKPTQRDKMIEIFSDLGEELENLQAKTLKDILTIRGDELDPEVKELMLLRLEGGKASTKKLKKMLQLVTPWDGRVRGGFLMFGAHTGRYSGKGIQPQNFTRGDYKPHQLENLFWFLINCDADVFECLWRRPIDAIAQGMRGFIKAPPGKKFVVSDFAAIEARVLAWLADEKDMLKVYARNGDVYITMAATLYKRDEKEMLRLKALDDKETIGQRKFAKDIVLGCGFQMGGVGFYRNCIMRGVKVEEEFCKKAVQTYRKAVPNIVKLWYDVEECAIEAVVKRATKRNPVVLRHLTFYMEGRWLCIGLPSGRPIRYIDPKVQLVERFGKMRNQLSFKTEYKGKWIRETTYGGKLAENVTQAVARDIMTESMVRANKRGYPIIATIHDELVCEVDEDFGSAKELEELMSELPRWAPGAPVSCEGWEGPRYRK